MESTISIKQIVMMLVKHIKLILITAIVCGIATYIYAVKVTSPLYISSGKLYVQNKVTNTENYSTGDINAAARLAVACSNVFTTEKVLQPISDELKQEYGLNLSSGILKSMISVEPVSGSELLQISVVGSDPVQAYRVCQMVIDVAPDAYKQLINAGTMVKVDDPKINYGKINGNETSTAMKGLMAGGVIAAAVAFLIEFLNKQVKPDDDLYAMYGIPVFAEILDFSMTPSSKKYGRYGRYGSYNSYNSYQKASQKAKKEANKEYSKSAKNEEKESSKTAEKKEAK